MMKKYGVLMGITAVMCLSVAAYGSAMQSQTPQVTLHTVASREMIASVSCDGAIEEMSKKDIYVNVPVLASDVKVSVGDHVKKGQKLLAIDQETSASLSSSSLSGLDTENLSQEVLSHLASSGMEISSGKTTSAGEIPDAVYAPVSGTITDINVTESSLTSPSKSLITISDLSKLRVKVSIPENEIGEVKVGQTAVITGTGFQGREYTGIVERIYPTAHQQGSSTGSESVVDALISIQSPDEYLKPNFSASVQIITDNPQDVLLVPYEAVRQDENGQEYVYLYSAGSAIRRDITTGREYADGAEVLSGIRQGDRIVGNPDAVTGNGMRVTVQKAGGSHA
ncbi:MAG: efflux RND transporter periplasmic adaptor subunit [Clostridiales bacterium]|nr:efflux RND transporter periplasmic adaptor subunit [Clostridiales bacterium]